MRPWMRLFAIAAGACDTTTGVLLVAAPELTLRMMHVRRAPAEPVFTSFIGAFVLGVGLSYLLPFALDAARLDERLSGTFFATTLVRASIALFTGVAAATGRLEPAWATVAASDLLVAAVQIAILAKAQRANA